MNQEMQAELQVSGLPPDAIGSARGFYDNWSDKVGERLERAEALVVLLPPATYDHDDWRRAAARDLARAHAPKRVNLLAGRDPAAIETTLAYLAGAPGVTGQYLQVR